MAAHVSSFKLMADLLSLATGGKRGLMLVLHWQSSHAGGLEAVNGDNAYWREAGKGLASMVVEVRPACTSLHRVRRPRSPEAVWVAASPRAASFTSSALQDSQRKASVLFKD